MIRSDLLRCIRFLNTVFILLLMSLPVAAKSPLPIDTQEFKPEDFQHFFALIVDGKITAEKMVEFCEDEYVGFTFTGADLVHEGERQRIDYNVTALDMTIDGRPFRSQYRAPSFGEWTREVFKPLCPGLYAFTVNFEATLPRGADAQDLSVQIYMQREGDTRPGLLLVEGRPAGTRKFAAGQTTVVVAMATGDEISTWTVMAGSKDQRTLTSVSISGYKIAHLPELVKSFDMEAWDKAMRDVGSRLGASVPAE
jgi:hypothetical protein